MARLRLPADIRPGVHAVRADYVGTAGVTGSNAAGTLRVAKAAPRVSFAVERRPGGRLRLAVLARIPGAQGIHPSGQLVVRDRGRIVRVGRLRRSDAGRTTVVLPTLRPGVHFLRVALSSGPVQQAAATGFRVLRVE